MSALSLQPSVEGVCRQPAVSQGQDVSIELGGWVCRVAGSQQCSKSVSRPERAGVHHTHWAARPTISRDRAEQSASSKHNTHWVPTGTVGLQRNGRLMHKGAYRQEAEHGGHALHLHAQGALGQQQDDEKAEVGCEELAQGGGSALGIVLACEGLCRQAVVSMGN